MLPRRSEKPRVTPAPTSVREAAAEFIRGTSCGWGRRDLATWLVCHYSPCLVSDATIHPDRVPDNEEPAMLSVASSGLDDEQVERLILDARSSVLRMLFDLAWPSQATAITQNAIGAGHVAPLRDAAGSVTWAPVGRRRMRLADRVASLFIADALNVPHQYSGITLCRSCGELGFTAAIAHESWCDRALQVA